MQAPGALPPAPPPPIYSPPDYSPQGYQPDGFEQGFEPGLGQQGYPPPPYPPPPPPPPPALPSGQPPYGAPVPPPPDVSDTVDRMLRPQGLFQQRSFGGQGGFGPEGQYAPQAQYPPQGQYAPQGQYGPQGQYPPQGEYGAPGQYGAPPPWPGAPDPADTPPRGMPPVGRGRMRMPGGGRRLMPAVIAAAMAVIVVVGVVVVLQSMRGNTSSPPTTAPSSTPTSSSAARASNRAQQQAATQLAGLLSQSGNDRGSVINAVDDIQNCGKTLAQDQQILAKAATNRRALLTRLGSLPGRSTLPPAMLSALTGAWQASAQDDTDLAKWAGDELARGCHKKTVNNDPNYQASLGPDNQATNEKQSFTAQWNPIARRDGLKTYQWEQL